MNDLFLFSSIPILILSVVGCVIFTRYRIKKQLEELKNYLNSIIGKKCIDNVTKEEFTITGSRIIYAYLGCDAIIGIKDKNGNAKKIGLNEIKITD